METSSWRCIPAANVPIIVLIADWHWLPSSHCPLRYCHFSNSFGILYRVIFLDLIFLNFFRRGSLLSATIFVYAICAPTNGYAGGSMYSRVGGKNWIKQMVVSAFLFPSIIATVALAVNAIAIYYHASRAIPFTTMVSFFMVNIGNKNIIFF